VVPLGGETVAVRQDGKRDTYKPALPPRFKAAIWVSPKGSGRGSLEFGLGQTRRAGGQGGGDGRRTTLTPERPGAWRPRKNTLTRLYKDGVPSVRTSRSVSPTCFSRIAVPSVGFAERHG